MVKNQGIQCIATELGFLDLSTGLEWLFLEKTIGKNPIEALKLFPQFRYGSIEEINNLFKSCLSSNVDLNDSLLAYCKATVLINFFGRTFSNIKSEIGLIGLAFGNPGDVETPTPIEISIQVSTQNGYCQSPKQPLDYLSGATHRHDTATFLVR